LGGSAADDLFAKFRYVLSGIPGVNHKPGVPNDGRVVEAGMVSGDQHGVVLGQRPYGESHGSTPEVAVPGDEQVGEAGSVRVGLNARPPEGRIT